MFVWGLVESGDFVSQFMTGVTAACICPLGFIGLLTESPLRSKYTHMRVKV